MANTIVTFLRNISITKKAFLLLVITTFGILFLGLLEHIGLYSIKHQTDKLYQNTIQNMATLQKINNLYNLKLATNLEKIKTKQLDSNHAILDLQEINLFANKYWNQLKQNDPIISKNLQPTLNALQQHLLQTITLLEKKGQDKLFKEAVHILQSDIKNFNQQNTQSFFHYYELIQKYRKSIQNHYDNTVYTSILFIILLLFLSLVLANNIYYDIRALLMSLSEIITQKTKEYQELALQLEYKVNKEVIKNREKDQIMYQHARLAAMGEMIGNIAHQWRQPLNALTVLIQSFEIKSLSGNLSQEFIDQQVKEGLRLANQMSNTIEDFKNFFSPHKEREYFGVVDALKETLELVEFFCKDEHIDIQLIAKEEIRVYGYASEFSQVILNLLNNARDNFKQKEIQKERKIVIKVEKKLHPEPFVMISFIDNGGGIDQNIIDRIFEPYFTTKHKSTGTGIGLYMSKQIIEKQMQGMMSVKNITSKLGTNQVYQCAQFLIALPIK